MTAGTETLLTVENLTVDFRTKSGWLRAVRGIDYSVAASDSLGIVGESGSGKSVGMLALLGLLPTEKTRITGDVRFQGIDLLNADPDTLRTVRGGQIGYVFQDSLSALNPVIDVGTQIAEVLRLHRSMSKSGARRRAAELLDLVGIPEPQERLGQYPHQFSGGMRQRVMIAAAIAPEPALLIADEPTTALDVTIQAQVLELLSRLRIELGMSTILISHDLGVVAGCVDRVAVMYAGRLAETGSTRDVLAAPLHPYTAGLLKSIPRLDRAKPDRLYGIPGRLPNPLEPIIGCSFSDRCEFAFDRCHTDEPQLEAAGDGRQKACWLETTPTQRPSEALRPPTGKTG